MPSKVFKRISANVNSVSPGLHQYAINRFRHPSVWPVGQTLLTGPRPTLETLYTILILTPIIRIIIRFTLVIISYNII